MSAVASRRRLLTKFFAVTATSCTESRTYGAMMNRRTIGRVALIPPLLASLRRKWRRSPFSSTQTVDPLTAVAAVVAQHHTGSAIDPGERVHSDLHGAAVGAAAPLGFRLDAASAYAMLVNALSVEVPTLLRVSPGNPDSSYLIQKLEGHAAVGGQMPLGQGAAASGNHKRHP